MLEVIKVFVSSLILIVTLFVSGIIIAKKKLNYNTSRAIILILVTTILNTFIYLYTDSIIKTLLICALYSGFINQIFKLEFSKSIFMGVLFVILLVIPDFITFGSIIYVFNVSKDYYYQNLAGGVISNAMVGGLMVLLTFLIKKPLRKLTNYNLSTNKKIIVMTALILISLAFFFYSLINTFEFNNDIIGYLVVIAMLIIVLFSLFKQKIDNENISKKYDELLEIMKTYEDDVEEQRTIIHETQNELMTIKCKIHDKEENKEIIYYIDSILGDKATSSMSKYAKFKYLPSNGLKGFFYYKFMEAEKKGIKVSVNISKKIEESFLGEIDTNSFKQLVRIIGVYLDNAIEASVDSEQKKLGIEVYMIKGYINIIISNTFIGNADTDKIGNVAYSTKGKTRGHGLLLVKRILYSNNRFEAKTEIINDLYIQNLKIKNCIKK